MINSWYVISDAVWSFAYFCSAFASINTFLRMNGSILTVYVSLIFISTRILLRILKHFCSVTLGNLHKKKQVFIQSRLRVLIFFCKKKMFRPLETFFDVFHNNVTCSSV